MQTVYNLLKNRGMSIVQIDFGIFTQSAYDKIRECMKPFIEKFPDRLPDLNKPVYTGKVYAWTCWWQGLENAPDIVKICVESQRRNIPEEAQQVVITKRNYKKYIELPDYIVEKVNAGGIALPTLSDIIRGTLLYKYGGFWMDATLLLLKPLSQSILDYPIYTRNLPETQFCTNAMWAGWFLYAKPGHKLFHFLSEGFFYYYSVYDRLQEYLMIDYIIAIACNTYPEITRQLKEVPYNNENALELCRHLPEQFDEGLYERYTKNTEIQKLSYKLNKEGMLNESDTFYQHLVKKYGGKDMEANRPVIIYGAGFRGGRTFLTLAENNVHVEAFCDRDADNIPKYFGCDVLTYEEATQKFPDLPYIVAIDNENARKTVMDNLKQRGAEAYEGLEEFFQGLNDAMAETVFCGKRAGFWVVPSLIRQQPGLVAYCFGIGFDFSFEMELARDYGMQVYAFDPSAEVVDDMKNQELPANLKYYPYGLSDTDGLKTFYLPSSGQDYSEYFAPWTSSETVEMQVYRLPTLMDKFGHNHIDLLKMDIEGSEFVVLPDILKAGIKFDQLCIETHTRILPDSVNKMREIKQLLNMHGYVMVSNGVTEQTYVYRDVMDKL